MRSGVTVEEMTIGTGERATAGTIVPIHYRGVLTRGDQFRSSYEEGQPLRVHVGRREVIAGMELGLRGMRVGGRWRLKFVHERTATAKLTTTRSGVRLRSCGVEPWPGCSPALKFPTALSIAKGAARPDRLAHAPSIFQLTRRPDRRRSPSRHNSLKVLRACSGGQSLWEISMTQRRCPFCMEAIHDGALKCKECGSLLYSLLASPHARSVQPWVGETYWLPVPSSILGILCVLTLMDGAQFEAETRLGGVLFSGAALGLGTASLIRQ
jgi:hypothetical protein